MQEVLRTLPLSKDADQVPTKPYALFMEHIGKIRSPKGSGRNFSLNNKIAAENTIKSLVSVAIYFLKYLRTLIGYGFRHSENNSTTNKFRCGT